MGDAASPKITAKRGLSIEHTTWRVTEFDGGGNFMLTADGAVTRFLAHFTAEQWAEFQKLIAGGQS